MLSKNQQETLVKIFTAHEHIIENNYSGIVRALRRQQLARFRQMAQTPKTFVAEFKKYCKESAIDFYNTGFAFNKNPQNCLPLNITLGLFRPSTLQDLLAIICPNITHYIVIDTVPNIRECPLSRMKPIPLKDVNLATFACSKNRIFDVHNIIDLPMIHQERAQNFLGAIDHRLALQVYTHNSSLQYLDQLLRGWSPTIRSVFKTFIKKLSLGGTNDQGTDEASRIARRACEEFKEYLNRLPILLHPHLCALFNSDDIKIRPHRELAEEDDEVQVETARRTRVYTDSSTDSTKQFASSVEFPEGSIVAVFSEQLQNQSFAQVAQKIHRSLKEYTGNLLDRYIDQAQWTRNFTAPNSAIAEKAITRLPPLLLEATLRQNEIIISESELVRVLISLPTRLYTLALRRVQFASLEPLALAIAHEVLSIQQVEAILNALTTERTKDNLFEFTLRSTVEELFPDLFQKIILYFQNQAQQSRLEREWADAALWANEELRKSTFYFLRQILAGYRHQRHQIDKQLFIKASTFPEMYAVLNALPAAEKVKYITTDYSAPVFAQLFTTLIALFSNLDDTHRQEVLKVNGKKCFLMRVSAQLEKLTLLFNSLTMEERAQAVINLNHQIPLHAKNIELYTAVFNHLDVYNKIRVVSAIVVAKHINLKVDDNDVNAQFVRIFPHIPPEIWEFINNDSDIIQLTQRYYRYAPSKTADLSLQQIMAILHILKTDVSRLELMAIRNYHGKSILQHIYQQNPRELHTLSAQITDPKLASALVATPLIV